MRHVLGIPLLSDACGEYKVGSWKVPTWAGGIKDMQEGLAIFQQSYPKPALTAPLN